MVSAYNYYKYELIKETPIPPLKVHTISPSTGRELPLSASWFFPLSSFHLLI
jgi:hypothetical protein